MQNKVTDGKALVGDIASDRGFVSVSAEWTAASVDKVFFTASRPYLVTAILGRVEVAGTDAGAVSAVVKKAASGTAIASGTALHSGSLNLKGTAASNQALTLSTTPADIAIAAGDTIGIDFTGTLTNATGSLTVLLAPR
jgi:hypothetical protein